MSPRIIVIAAVLLYATTPVRAEPNGPIFPIPDAPTTTSQKVAHHMASQLFPTGNAIPSNATLAISVEWASPPTSSASNTGQYSEFLAHRVEQALRKRGLQGARMDTSPDARFRVTIRLSLNRNTLVADGALYWMPLSVWERLRLPSGNVLRSTQFDTLADFELRQLSGISVKTLSYTVPQPEVLPLSVPLPSQGGPVLDIQITDVDDDLASEIILLRRGQVRTLQRRGRQWHNAARCVLKTDLPVNPAKLRAPLGRIMDITAADGKKQVYIASSDYQRVGSLIYTGKGTAGVVRGRHDRPTANKGCRIKRPPANRDFSGWPGYAVNADKVLTLPWPQAVDTLKGEASIHVLSTGVPSTENAASSLRTLYDLRTFPGRKLNDHQASGRPTKGEWNPTIWQPYRIAVGTSGTIHLQFGSQQLSLKQHGTSIAICDVNHDGLTEVLVTAPVVKGHDTLTLYTLQGNQAQRRWRKHLKPKQGLVTAMACGDLDGDGQREFVVATHRRTGVTLLTLGASR
jgi:hypothetical protein